MKKLVAYCLLLSIAQNAVGQFYLRGTVKSNKNIPLANAKVYLHSTHIAYTTGHDGSFGITTSLPFDSVAVYLDGYEQQNLKVKTDKWQDFILQPQAAVVEKNKAHLISFTKNAESSNNFYPFINHETYFKLVENEFVKTNTFPNTGYSLNINKASYSNIRRFINMGSKVPPDAVRIEEMINYFNIGYETPQNNQTFKINSSIEKCPWNDKNNLLFLNLSAKKIDINNAPPSNLVFLIDVSGSMDMPNRLPLLKEAFQLFVKNLRVIDKVTIVTYGGMVSTWLAATNGDKKDEINNRLEVLNAEGDTPGESAIDLAYKLARATFIPGGNNRVILATDGDFNVGQTSEKALDDIITKHRQTGIYLTCLGVGMGNLKDSKLQTLAKRGNGNYAYLDDLHEAEKVLVNEISQTLYAVADDATVNIKFNPLAISSYRLIGFDNKKEAIENANSDLDGGEIGSGSTSLAIFEIEPNSNNTALNIAELKLQFHDVADSMKAFKQTNNYTVNQINAINNPTVNSFAAVVAMYGMKLKESTYTSKLSWADIRLAAEKAVDKTIFLQNDFLTLVDKTVEIYEPSKKKRKIKKEESK